MTLDVIFPKQHSCFYKIKGKPECWVLYFYYTAFADNFGGDYFQLATDREPKLPLGVIKTFNQKDMEKAY